MLVPKGKLLQKLKRSIFRLSKSSRVNTTVPSRGTAATWSTCSMPALSYFVWSSSGCHSSAPSTRTRSTSTWCWITPKPFGTSTETMASRSTPSQKSADHWSLRFCTVSRLSGFQLSMRLASSGSEIKPRLWLSRRSVQISSVASSTWNRWRTWKRNLPPRGRAKPKAVHPLPQASDPVLKE